MVTVDVGVVIVTYNSADVIGALLGTLDAAMGDLACEIVVVDNGSGDGTAELVEGLVEGHTGTSLPITVVRQGNRGYSAGINAAVAALSHTTAVLILNPDTRLAESSVRAMWQALEADAVGIVVPKILDEQQQLAHSLRRTPTLGRALGLGFTGLSALSEYVTSPAAYQRGHIVDWATGAVMLVRREVHDALGGWDETYFLYSEETDFCFRARERGWATWFEPQAVATHQGGGSGRSATTHVMQIVNRVRFYARGHGAIASTLYLGFTVLSEASWWVRGHPYARASITALLRPSSRPVELGCSDSLIPT